MVTERETRRHMHAEVPFGCLNEVADCRRSGAGFGAH